MYHTKAIIKNAFRISKVRGESAIRIRVPGGDLNARHLKVVKELAERFGNGSVHVTTRQGFEIPGIKLHQLDEIRRVMSSMIAEIEKECHLVLENPQAGYPASGTRNVSACIGDRVCRFANCDAPRLAQKIEKAIYPNDYHLKVAVTACPNDCIKAHMQDIGIIAGVEPVYDSESCIACEACLENCRAFVTNALKMEDHRIIRDEECCLLCGECILKCPTGALSRGKQFYRVLLGGRTGKRNPRLAGTFIQNAVEDVVLTVCRNIYSFIDRHIDRTLPKELVGYIIDRAGFDAFVAEVMEGITLNPEAKVVAKLVNPGYAYPVKK